MDKRFTGPDRETAARLLENQNRLQQEADSVLADLDLLPLLETIGQTQLVGSAVTGLMAWRDIDVSVICDPLDPQRIWSALRPLAAHPGVKKLRWSNESDRFNPTGLPQDEGFYLGIHYRRDGTNTGPLWKLDCWFLTPAAPRLDLALIDRLASSLDEETRLAVLWIKSSWAVRPEYRNGVYSVDIYEAVLDHGVRSPGAFAAWLERRKP
ncbi:MAG: hypothetical protein M3173_00150 [Chloroflexota bacterium]|nr:hypothetical protein [Chloroflexota bacterium]